MTRKGIAFLFRFSALLLGSILPLFSFGRTPEYRIIVKTHVEDKGNLKFGG